MKSLPYLLAIASSLFIFSCSSDDENSSADQSPMTSPDQSQVVIQQPTEATEPGVWSIEANQDQNLLDSIATADIARTLLIEKVTAAGCPLCPDVTFLIDEFEEEYGEQIIAVKYHSGPLAVGNFVDVDFTTPQGNEIVADVIATRGQPRGYVSRAPRVGETSLSDRASSWEGIITDRINETSDLYIDAETSINGNTLDIDINLISQSDINTSDRYRINVFITEDDIVHSQSGATSDFIHTDMFRNAATDVFGDLIDIDIDANTEYTYTSQVALSSEWVQENLNVVIFITEDDDNSSVGGQIVQALKVSL